MRTTGAHYTAVPRLRSFESRNNKCVVCMVCPCGLLTNDNIHIRDTVAAKKMLALRSTMSSDRVLYPYTWFGMRFRPVQEQVLQTAPEGAIVRAWSCAHIRSMIVQPLQIATSLSGTSATEAPAFIAAISMSLGILADYLSTPQVSATSRDGAECSWCWCSWCVVERVCLSASLPLQLLHCCSTIAAPREVVIRNARVYALCFSCQVLRYENVIALEDLLGG